MEKKIVELRENFKDPHYLIPTSDGKVLFLRAWLPPTTSTEKKKTAILIFHGITAYSGFYKIMGEPLAKKGYSVFGLDLRGHGLSDGVRGDYPSVERLEKDISETISFLKEKFQGLVLLGHSLGNLLALTALNQHLNEIDGLILISVARTIKESAYPPMSLGQKLKLFFKMITSYKKPVITYPRKEYLQEISNNDPLFIYDYTPRFMSVLNTKKFQKKYKFPEKLEIPVFVAVADQDELFSIESVRKFHDEIPSQKKEFHVIVNAKHAEYPEGAWDRLVDWVSENFE